MQDPFEAGQREALQKTDELLDRIAARTPTPEDLDDPVVAALALMAAEIDLDAVPLETTRAAVEQALPAALRDRQWAPSEAATGQEPGFLLDLRDRYADSEAADVLGAYRPRVGGGLEWAGDYRSSRLLRRGRHPEHAAVAMAPPRSLPRFAAPSGRPERTGGATRPEGRPEHRLRTLTAAVVAVAAIVLGTSVSAAVTGGRSINPLTGLQQVVAQVVNGRTPEQQNIYEADLQRIDAAKARLQQGDQTQAVHELSRVTTVGLPLEDADHVLSQVKLVIKQLRR